jgi:hypothetical protein
MSLLSRVLASSAVALVGFIVAGPASVDALATGSELGHLAARHMGGVSPNHHALARRKRNVHKNRKRCQQRPTSPTTTPTPAPQETNNNSGDYPGDNENNNENTTTNNNSGNPSTSVSNPAPTTQVPPPANSGDGKLILAWPNGDEQSAVPQYFTGKAKYYYTWSPHRVASAPSSVKFCPMLWGDHQISDFTSLVVPGYADCVLGMNEPQQHDQSNMDVAHGVYLWNTYIGPLASQGYSILGSPAPTSAPDGLVWVQQFLDQVGVKPNVICIHWYDVGFPKFQEYVTNFWSQTGQRTIWVTEFACQNFNGGAQCNEGEVWSFVQQATAWMDQTEWIGGYAPFGFMRDMVGVNELNSLMNDDFSPTALGHFFIYSS